MENQEKLGGKIIKISPDNTTTINPLENMVKEKVIVCPIDDVMLQSNQFTKQLGVVTSVLKEVRKFNTKEIEKL
ncbi:MULTISPECIES: hypothetical protein [Bacillus cereus group]|uniref:hypothetical protein n=1 Tax=Bacillus cereus group TaxID=86661 RepID=UPI0011514EE8|nr:hypothetical protein [Bacillus cytotoxicus]HDR7741136.1 hypothetical protein [Bacillus pacificus]MDH2866140.1 hypothetical protein [Bacillus cytotoxicus]NZD34382.1 hypothetical protein [Bacillus cytotoxicus]HDR7214414.1 hypothetical protein [Bacillus cytotoxicus]HDR7969271.1 hypothetical protein [Bacillus pacificus]